MVRGEERETESDEREKETDREREREGKIALYLCRADPSVPSICCASIRA